MKTNNIVKDIAIQIGIGICAVTAVILVTPFAAFFAIKGTHYLAYHIIAPYMQFATSLCERIWG